MFGNLTPQDVSVLESLDKIVKLATDPDFFKKRAAELKKVQKAKTGLAEREKSLGDSVKQAGISHNEALKLKADLDVEADALAKREEGIATGEANLKAFKKAFQDEKREFMADLRAKMNDLDLRDVELIKLRNTSETMMKQARAKEASLKPKLDLIEKLRV